MLTPTSARFAIYDPRGVIDAVVAPVAPRPKTLDSLRLGILDNSKWNANKLLRGASATLGKTIAFADVRYYVKHSFSIEAAPALIAEIAGSSDIVLTAIGDCGSCTSCCIRDAIALERLGIPTAAIVTTEFVRETELQRSALGMEGLLPIIIRHPVSAITDAEVAERVQQISAQAPEIWLGRPATPLGGGLAKRIAAGIAALTSPYQDESSAREALALAGCQP